MPFFMDNLLVNDSFLAEFCPSRILSADKLNDIQVNE